MRRWPLRAVMGSIRLMRDALSTGSARSGVLDAHALRYLEGQLDGGFRMQLMVKDLGIAAALGDVTASGRLSGFSTV